MWSKYYITCHYTSTYTDLSTWADVKLLNLLTYFRCALPLKHKHELFCHHMACMYVEVTLNRSGSDLNSCTCMARPIRVAMLQCGMVGVNMMVTVLLLSLTSMCSSFTTHSSSRVRGCSGSLIQRTRSIK